MTSDDVLTALARAAGAGDRAALEQFVRLSQRDVWRFVAHLTSPAEADDLTQDTFMRAIPSLPRFAGRSTARTWLLSIARRVFADHLRVAYRSPRVVREDDWESAAERVHRRAHGAGFEDVVEANMLLEGLDADRREALVLTGILGLTYAEAARICECPVGTVRSRVARAREDLVRKTTLGDHRTDRSG